MSKIYGILFRCQRLTVVAVLSACAYFSMGIGPFANLLIFGSAFLFAVWWLFAPPNAVLAKESVWKTHERWAAYSFVFALLGLATGVLLLLDGVYHALDSHQFLGVTEFSLQHRVAMPLAWSVFSVWRGIQIYKLIPTDPDAPNEPAIPAKTVVAEMPKPVAPKKSASPEKKWWQDDFVQIAGLMSIVSGASGWLEDAGEAASSTSPIAGLLGAGAVMRFRDGSGNNLQITGSGEVYQNGKFLGRRDSSGRIIDGGGNFLGTLKGSGEFFRPDGTYQGRLFK